MIGAGFLLGLVIGAASGLGIGLWWLGMVNAEAAATMIGSGFGAGFSVWGALYVSTYQNRIGAEAFSALAHEAGAALKRQAFSFLEALDEAAKFPLMAFRGDGQMKSLMLLGEEETQVFRELSESIDGIKEAMHVFTEQIAGSPMGSIEMRLALVRFRGVIASSEARLGALLSKYKPRQRLTEGELVMLEHVGMALVNGAQQFETNRKGRYKHATMRRRYGPEAPGSQDSGPRDNSSTRYAKSVVSE